MDQKENTGSLFPNKYKEPGDKKPNMKGTVNIEGKIFDVAAWTYETKDGEKYLSLKFQEPREKTESTPSDDLPF